MWLCEINPTTKFDHTEVVRGPHPVLMHNPIPSQLICVQGVLLNPLPNLIKPHLMKFGSYLLLYSVINPRRACAARVTVVGSVCLCVCVCLSMLQLTPRLFVRPANDTIYFTGNDNQFDLAVFSPLQRSERCQHSTHTNSRPFFTLRKRACALFLPRGGSRSEFWLSYLRARFAHNVKLVYHQG